MLPMLPSEIKVTTDQLVRELAKAMDIHIGDAKLCVKLLFEILRDHVVSGRVVKVNNFGSFSGQRIESRIITVDGVTTVKRAFNVKFKPSKRGFYV